MTLDSAPWLLPAPEGAVMTVWVIYDHPKDFPEGYVLRPQYAMKDNSVEFDEVAWYADDPDKLRAIVPPGKIQMPRAPEDDPVIIEVWI